MHDDHRSAQQHFEFVPVSSPSSGSQPKKRQIPNIVRIQAMRDYVRKRDQQIANHGIEPVTGKNQAKLSDLKGRFRLNASAREGDASTAIESLSLNPSPDLPDNYRMDTLAREGDVLQEQVSLLKFNNQPYRQRLADDFQSPEHQSSSSPLEPQFITISGPLAPLKAHSACPSCRAESTSSNSQRRLGLAPLGNFYFGGQRFGTTCPRNGFPHLTPHCEQWIRERTGQKPRFHDLYSDDWPLSHFSETDGITTSVPAKAQVKQTLLPKRCILDRFVSEFTNSDFSLVFPLINSALFEETVRLAYSSDKREPPLEHISARACVLAFVSMAGSHFPTAHSVSHIDGDSYSRDAQILLADIIEDASITTLQTIIMLVRNVILP